MKDLTNITGEIKEIKGFPLRLLVPLMPSTVTQFAGRLVDGEWVLSYVERVDVPSTDEPKLS